MTQVLTPYKSRDDNSLVHEKLGVILDVMILKDMFSQVSESSTGALKAVLNFLINVSFLRQIAAEVKEVLDVLQGPFTDLNYRSMILVIWILLVEYLSFLGVECEAELVVGLRESIDSFSKIFF